MDCLPVETLQHVGSFLALRDFISFNLVSQQFSLSSLRSWNAWYHQYLNYIQSEVRTLQGESPTTKKAIAEYKRRKQTFEILQKKSPDILSQLLVRWKDGDDLLRIIRGKLTLLVANKLGQSIKESIQALIDDPLSCRMTYNVTDCFITKWNTLVTILNRLNVFPEQFRGKIVHSCTGKALKNMLDDALWVTARHNSYITPDEMKLYKKYPKEYPSKIEYQLIRIFQVLTQYSNSLFVQSIFNESKTIFETGNPAIIRCMMNDGYNLQSSMTQCSKNRHESIVLKHFDELIDSRLINTLKEVPGFLHSIRKVAIQKPEHFLIPASYIQEATIVFNLELSIYQTLSQQLPSEY